MIVQDITPGIQRQNPGQKSPEERAVLAEMGRRLRLYWEEERTRTQGTHRTAPQAGVTHPAGANGSDPDRSSRQDGDEAGFASSIPEQTSVPRGTRVGTAKLAAGSRLSRGFGAMCRWLRIARTPASTFPHRQELFLTTGEPVYPQKWWQNGRLYRGYPSALKRRPKEHPPLPPESSDPSPEAEGVMQTVNAGGSR